MMNRILSEKESREIMLNIHEKKMEETRASGQNYSWCSDVYNGGGERERERDHIVTLYWNRNRPQKRLYRSAVSRERFTAVALVLLMTTGMKLYRPNMHALNPM